MERKTPPRVMTIAVRAASLIAAVILVPVLLGDLSQARPTVTGPGETTLLPGQRIETGTVVEVTAEQIAVTTHALQPRYLVRKKGLSFNVGDTVEMVINPQNAIVDYYPTMAGRPIYEIVEGSVAVPLEIGHEYAVIETQEAETRAFRIQSVVRSKIASIPVGVQAVFLVDNGTILDANFASEEAVERAEERPHEKSPIKGAHRQVVGTILEPAASGRVTIAMPAGNHERSYEVRSHIMKKLANLKKGQHVILLVDGQDKVIDVAIPPETAG